MRAPRATRRTRGSAGERPARGDAGPALGKEAVRVVARGRIRGPGAAAVPAGQRAREVKCHADPAAAG